jgi:arylsulfatase A-like enzyme
MQGFERISYYFEPRGDPEQTGNDIESGMERALDWIDTLVERPFFLLFHSYETHSPYRAREPYFGQFRGGPWTGESPQLSTVTREPQRDEGFLIRSWLRERVSGPVPGYRHVEPERLPLLQDLYDSSVAFADHQVGRLLDRLVRRGLDDDTVVIITSDHGESLGERGLAGHSSLQECELLVPLIVATPSRQGAGTRVPAQVRLLDVAPTVLDLLDLEPLEGVAGRSLMPLLSGRRADIPDEAWSYAGSSNFGLGLRVANRLKYTYNNSPWPPIRGHEALYRLDEDPGERTNVAGEDPRVADELRARVREHFETSTSGLQVSIANRERLPMAVALKGRLVTPLQVKAFDFGGTEVDWRGQSFCFTLPPGRNARLFLEGRVLGELLVSLDVRGSGIDGHGLSRIVNLDLLEGPWLATLTEGEWVDDPSGDLERVTGVRVAVEGARLRLRRDRGGIGEELREQLRVLGYVP